MTQQERPQNVGWFETLSVAALGLEIAFVSGLTWHDLIWVPIMLWVILKITRRKSSSARWVFSSVYVIGFALMAYLAVMGMFRLSDTEWTGWMFSVVALVQLALLWSTAMSEWLASKKRSLTGLQTSS